MPKTSPARIIGAIALVILMSATCVMLGSWQWGRHQQKVAAADQVERAWDAPVQSIDEILADGIEITNEWQRVEISGEFVPGSAAVLRGRHVAGTPTTTVLALFRATTSGADVGIIVALGWQDPDGAIPTLPSGPRDLVVRLRAEERSRGGTPVVASVTEMNTQDIVRSMGDAAPSDLPVLQGYAQVTAAQPPLADFPEPESLNGTNLSYALQWWFFAAAIPVGAVLLARREKEESAGVVRQRHRGRAEEEEDALIEAQLAATRE